MTRSTAMAGARLAPGSRALRAEPAAELADEVADQVEIATQVFRLHRAPAKEVERRAATRNGLIPADFDYPRASRALVDRGAAEAQRARPETIGQAARISGMTPAAISLLLVHLKHQRRLRPDVRWPARRRRLSAAAACRSVPTSRAGEPLSRAPQSWPCRCAEPIAERLVALCAADRALERDLQPDRDPRSAQMVIQHSWIAWPPLPPSRRGDRVERLLDVGSGGGLARAGAGDRVPGSRSHVRRQRAARRPPSSPRPQADLGPRERHGSSRPRRALQRGPFDVITSPRLCIAARFRRGDRSSAGATGGLGWP